MIIVNKAINIPYTENLLFARKMIAEAFEIGVDDFKVYVNGKVLEEDDNDSMIRDIGFNIMYMIKKKQPDTQEPHPKNLLVGNHEFFNLMFDLLSHDEDYDVDTIWKLLMKLPQDEVPNC